MPECKRDLTAATGVLNLTFWIDLGGGAEYIELNGNCIGGFVF